VPESAFRMLDEKLDVDNILCIRIRGRFRQTYLNLACKQGMKRG
jgi:hypothetical protein